MVGQPGANDRWVAGVDQRSEAMVSDAEIRSLERECLTPQDEVRLFRARARAGEVRDIGLPAEARLALAAYAGHAGAKQLLPHEAYPPPGGVVASTLPCKVFCGCSYQGVLRKAVDEGGPLGSITIQEGVIERSGELWTCPTCGESTTAYSLTLEGWLSGLSRWGHQALLRAALAAAKVAVDYGTCEWCDSDCGCSSDEAGGGHPHLAHGPCPDCQAASKAIEAVRDYVEDPTEARLDACDDCARPGLPGSVWQLLRAPRVALRNPGAINCAVAEVRDEGAVRAAIQAELVRWAFA